MPGACKIGTTLATVKSASLLESSEVCRAWSKNDAIVMVLDENSVAPDPSAVVGGSQATCDRKVVKPVKLDGSGGNVDEEGTQIGFTEPAEPPKGVVLPKKGPNPVWIRSSSFGS